jgi:stage II sporulation protein D
MNRRRKWSVQRRSFRSISLSILLLSLFAPAGCRWGGGPSRASLEGVPVMRVRLITGANEVAVGAMQPAMFRSSGDRQARRLSFPESSTVTVSCAGGQWRVGNVSLPAGELEVVPEVDGTIEIAGRRYHGSYRFVPAGDGGGKFDVVNHVDIESYLQGVLPRELFKDWDEQAYRAQAVVARTYALYERQAERSADRHWDVFADTRSQVYGGIKDETGKGNEAVEATRGIVVAYGPAGGERIFKAYFSACCGGIGQNVTDTMGGNYIPPLGDKNVGALCAISPRYSWAPVTVSKPELTRRVRGWGATRNHPVQRLQALDRLDVAYVNRFGRPVKFMIADANGQQYLLGSEETRWAANYDRGEQPQIWSSFFKPVNYPGEVVFSEGRGFGHGVGMCQWCAQSLALQGVPAEDIVRFSYPSAVLVRAY